MTTSQDDIQENVDTETQVEVQTEVQEEIQAEAPAEQVEAQEEKPKQSRSQDRKYRQRRIIREQQEKITRLEEQVKKIDALEEKLNGVVNPPPPRPSRVDFETEEDYEDALLEHFHRRQVQPTPKDVPQAAPEPMPAPPVNYELEEKWEESVEKAEEKYSDFQAVIHGNIPITPLMADAIKSQDEGGEIAYFLGKNVREAERIAQMHPVDQIQAIAELGSKFKTTTTQAPEPIEPIQTAESEPKPKVDPLLAGATFT